ncbi:MAG: nfsA [Bacteroidetes bacterium]|jgi:nitroreductase|nr:nfsA [Bacteroidota bacterium]
MSEIKEAKTQYEVIDLIRKRWSARSFLGKEITEKDLMAILEAGSWAFSGNNEQPWRVIPAHRGSENFEKIVAALAPGNTPWAKNAAVLMVSVAKTTADKEGNPFNAYAEHDLGTFNATLALQAFSMGIFSHPMAGFDKSKISASFSLAENLKPMVVIALGYLDEADKLEEPYKTRELTARTRKAVSELILK